MKNEENTLSAAKEILFQSITLDERIMQMKVLLDGIKMQKLSIKSCASLMDLAEGQGGEVTDEMEEEQEKRKETLRGIKNAFHVQFHLLKEAMKTTDEL